jgi:hypothetical protein
MLDDISGSRTAQQLLVSRTGLNSHTIRGSIGHVGTQIKSSLASLLSPPVGTSPCVQLRANCRVGSPAPASSHNSIISRAPSLLIGSLYRCAPYTRAGRQTGTACLQDRGNPPGKLALLSHQTRCVYKAGKRLLRWMHGAQEEPTNQCL